MDNWHCQYDEAQ